jgi:hypothetical protein
MRYSLRTLIVLMMLGGPACAWGYQEWKAFKAREAERKEKVAAASWPSGFTPTLDFQYRGKNTPVLVNGKWEFTPESDYYGTEPR